MGAKRRTKADRESTAIHEAAHAVVQLATGIGLKSVTIVRDYREMSEGCAIGTGDHPEDGSDAESLKAFAEDAFWLRHAIARLAGAEAVRQLRSTDAAEEGAGDDQKRADDALNSITGDEASFELYSKLAKRRCVLLVEHYRPEIELVAAELLKRRTLLEDQVRELVSSSLLTRRARHLSW